MKSVDHHMITHRLAHALLMTGRGWAYANLIEDARQYIADLEEALREVLPIAAAHLLSDEERVRVNRARALIGGSK